MKKIIIVGLILFAGLLIAKTSSAASFGISIGRGGNDCYWSCYGNYNNYNGSNYGVSYGYFGGSQVAYNQFWSGYGTYKPVKFNTNAVIVTRAPEYRWPVLETGVNGAYVNQSSYLNAVSIPTVATTSAGECGVGRVFEPRYNVCVGR